MKKNKIYPSPKALFHSPSSKASEPTSGKKVTPVTGKSSPELVGSAMSTTHRDGQPSPDGILQERLEQGQGGEPTTRFRWPPRLALGVVVGDTVLYAIFQVIKRFAWPDDTEPIGSQVAEGCFYAISVIAITSELGSVNGKVEAIQLKLDAHWDKVDDMPEKLNYLGKKVDVMQVKFDNLENKVDAMQVKFDNLENKVDDMQVKLDNLENKVDDMQVKLEYLENKVDASNAEIRAEIKAAIEKSEEKMTAMIQASEEKMTAMIQASEEKMTAMMQAGFDHLDQKLDRLERLLTKNSKLP